MRFFKKKDKDKDENCMLNRYIKEVKDYPVSLDFVREYEIHPIPYEERMKNKVLQNIHERVMKSSENATKRFQAFNKPFEDNFKRGEEQEQEDELNPLTMNLDTKRFRGHGYRVYTDRPDYCYLCGHFDWLVYVIGWGNWLRCGNCLKKLKPRDKTVQDWYWMKGDKLYFVNNGKTGSFKERIRKCPQ